MNLAPAKLNKEGAAYDLPMAVAILLASEQVPPPADPPLFLGELSLDGALRHTQGILPMVALAHERDIRPVVVPAINASEAALIGGLSIVPASSLGELVVCPSCAQLDLASQLSITGKELHRDNASRGIRICTADLDSLFDYRSRCG